MIDQFLNVISHPFVLLFFGLFTHFGRKILAAASHGSGNYPSFTDYWKKNPIQSILSMMGAMVGYVLFAHFPDFDKMAPDIQNVVRTTAFSMGYMADNIADAVGDKAINKIKGG